MKSCYGLNLENISYLFHTFIVLGINSSMKKRANSKISEKKEQLADLFSLPKDIVCGASNVTIIGSMRVIIENYKGILEYNNEEIILQGKQSKIKICGACLKIRCYNEEEMVIDGRIDGVLFFQ